MIDLRRVPSYGRENQEDAVMTREQLRRQGEATRTRLFGTTAHEPAGFGTLLTEAVHGAIWNRPGLARADRMLCTLAALAVWPRLRQLRRHIAAALDLGLSPEAIREVLVQAGLYAGFSAAEETLALATEVFAERGVPAPPDPPTDTALETLTRRGRELMRRVHGERSVQGYAAPDNPVTYALYELAIQYGYGEIWFRPGLEPRARALVAVAAFTALRLPEQARRFGQAALNLGVSRTEVIEAVIQTAPYSGFPPALNVLSALSDVLH
jgi:alkylhydroperoxidase/carboxymuconolactone decarboxylase family protein YurZ